MSKHLRFGRLLGLLAIMLTLSFAWAQGQNQSSEKVLSDVKLFAEDNPGGSGGAKLFGDIEGSVDSLTKVVSIDLPYRYNTGQPDAIGSQTLVVSFKSSKFSNVFKTQGSATDLMDLTPVTGWRATHAIGQGFGNESNAPWIMAVQAFTYADGEVITVEAENHSYVYYTLDIDILPASTLNNILSMDAAWMKTWSTNCVPGADTGEVPNLPIASTITVNVPFGTDLANVVLRFTVDPFTKVFLGPEPTTPILRNPLDSDSLTLNANLSDLTNGIKIYVYSQSYPTVVPTPKIYTVKAVVGVPSELDVMHQLAFLAEDNPQLTEDVYGELDPATQKWTVVVPFGTDIATLKASWEISKYARMFSLNPHTVGNPLDYEICSESVLTSSHWGWGWWHWLFCWWWELIYGPDVECGVFPPCDDEEIIHYGELGELFGDGLTECTSDGLEGLGGSFWVRAEDPSDVSEYPFCIVEAEPSPEKTLFAISGNWMKENRCDPKQGFDTVNYPRYWGHVVGEIDQDEETITFTVPYGVSQVQVANPFVVSTSDTIKNWSYLATTTTAAGNYLVDGGLVSIVPQIGSPRDYEVIIVNEDISSERELLSFGFNWEVNTGLGFDWNSEDYIIDPSDVGWDAVNRRITVTVPYVTDLHHLKAFFTASDFSCVSIANTNGNLPQVSDVTENDHSNTLTYVVTAEDGTQERYQVMVVKEAVSKNNSIVEFALTAMPLCEGTYLKKRILGGTAIAGGAKCSSATEVQSGQNIISMHGSWFKYTADKDEVITITSDDPHNVTVPFSYSYDTYLRVYSDCKGTLLKQLDDMESASQINRALSTVTLTMNQGETVYIYWDDIWVDDCPTCNLPFYWNINHSYSSYEVGGEQVVISGNDITISVKYGSDLTNVGFAFNLATELCTVTINDPTNNYIKKAQFSTYVSGYADFTSPVSITVTAENYDQKVYNVKIKERPENSDKRITDYWFLASKNDIGVNDATVASGAVVINQVTRVITVHLPYGSDVDDLAAGFELNDGENSFPGGAVLTHSEDGQEIQESDVTTNDFHHQVAYTVFGEDCSTLEYFVNVIVDENEGNDLISLKLEGLEYAECDYEGVAFTRWVEGPANKFTIHVPYGTDMEHLHLTPTLSEGATIDPPLTAAVAYTGPWTLTVTAENGVSTQVYTLTLIVDAALTGSEMLSFGFEAENNPGLTTDRWTVLPINQTTFRIDVMVPFTIDLTTTELVATFTHSPMSCVYINGVKWTAEDLQTSGVSSNLYEDALTYTVKSQSGHETYYNVYVTKDNPMTEKSLSMFKLTDIAYCPGVNMSPAKYEIAGTGTTAITVSVKAGSDVDTVNYSFEVSPTATVKLGNVVLPKVGNKVTGTTNFTSTVTFTVYAQDGSHQAYTVTVAPRDPSSKKQLTKYWFEAAPVNAFTGGVADGDINETAKTVDVWVPWGTSVTDLVANFELNDKPTTFPGGVVMTHSEDYQYVQFSGVTENDFTDPVAYTVIAEDCTTVEYFVTVRMTPNTDTGISAFKFSYTDCGCNLKTIIDPYARRIYITVPSTVDISSLAPSEIVITPAIGTRPAATVSPKAGVAQNWKNGPVKYTVTAPDKVTTADWWVTVTNPPCTDTDILAFSLPDAQVSPSAIVPGFGVPVSIDAVNHKIHVYVKKGTVLTSVKYERTLPCGATICCVGGNCQDNRYMDFSQGGCHTCVVTAQDQTVTQEWTICVEELDGGKPLVTTWSVMAMNCSDSVAVQSNELGRVFIVNEAVINMDPTPDKCTPLFNLSDWTGTGDTSVAKLVSSRMGAWANVTAVDTPVYIKTNGLYSGMYWAFAVDASGNVSCISTEKLFLDMCDVTVATLCDLRNQPDVWRYTLSQEVVVTHQEPLTTGTWVFAQSADCGILIEDRVFALDSYSAGTGLTNLKGMLDKSGPMLKFIPVCCYKPTTASGKTVTPKSMTYSAFLSTAVGGAHVYESMLVKITKPLKINGSGNWALNMVYGTKDVIATDWVNTIATPLANVDYLKTATAMPTVQSFFTGLRFDVKPGDTEYGQLVPLKKAHIEAATAPILFGNPNPAMVGGLLPGDCKSVTIQIINEGVGSANITALYLDDAAATDEFHLVPTADVAVPFSIAAWTFKSVDVKFCPLDEGAETTNLIVEYGVGKTLVIPINGLPLVVVDIPACQSFNPPFPGASDFGASYQGWVSPPSNTTDLQNYVSSAWVNYDGTPVMNMRPRQQINGVRQTTYLITPGFNIEGSDPVIQWVEANSSNAWTGAKVSPRNLYISTDGATWDLVDTYTSADMPDAFTGQGWRKQIYSLKDYVGQTIWWKFELLSSNTATGYEYSYWCLDEICVQQRTTEPIISASPNPGAFGGVQVGGTGTLTFSVKNLGVSVLKIKKVELSGDKFSLTDTNTYPFEVTDGPGTWAYATGSNGSVLNFAVDFKPTDVGVKTGKIVITYGLYSDMKLEIPLSGEGLSCSTAAVATKGENHASGPNTWFKYTADKFSVVDITSCDPRQDVGYDVTYGWDSWLKVYSDCAGTLLAENDDINDKTICSYARPASRVQLVMNAGETIYIFWDGIFMNDCPTCDDPFYWHINASYPIDGDVCENAIPLTLNGGWFAQNHFGTTVGFGDDYNISPCSPFSNYMDGNDKVYSITIPYEGYLTGSLLGAYGSIHVLDLCPKEELEKFHCKAFTSGPTGGNGFDKKISEGTYFVIISTWAPPQTVDYLLNLSFRGTGVEDNALNSKLSVYPNPNDGKFNVSISNPEATDMTIELVSISGQVVYRNEVKAAYSYNEEIDASTFAKGVYYLKVNDAKGVKIEKVVVQ